MKKIVLQGATNVRDFAGTKAADGLQVKAGRLIRGDMLYSLTDEDKLCLREKHGLKTVVDLRTKTETGEKPDAEILGVTQLHIPISQEETVGISREKKVEDSFLSSDMPDMRGVYRSMIRSAYSQAAFRQVLRTIMEHESGAILWHCTAGKDRCGMTSVFVQHMLGVDWDAIEADYMETNEAAIPVADRFYHFVLDNTGDVHRAELVRLAFVADLDYLHAATEEMKLLCGGIDAYIEKVLGIDQRQILRFREKVLENR